MPGPEGAIRPSEKIAVELFVRAYQETYLPVGEQCLQVIDNLDVVFHLETISSTQVIGVVASPYVYTDKHFTVLPDGFYQQIDRFRVRPGRSEIGANLITMFCYAGNIAELETQHKNNHTALKNIDRLRIVIQ
jgi:hypothetical protein